MCTNAKNGVVGFESAQRRTAASMMGFVVSA
jgi:hypothetical protein